MKRLAIYLMCGRETPELAAAAVEGGADLIELGFPFSDPLADGPVVRAAAERALAEGMRTRECLDCLARTRALVDVPLVPMTYASLLEAYGWERFETDARAAGADSLIVADLPADAHDELRRVQLVAPTSTDERIRIAAERTDGWLYLVTVAGTTGARDDLSPALAGLVERARALTDVPLHAGFGISTPAQARAAAELADGVVVGSAALLAADGGPEALARLRRVAAIRPGRYGRRLTLLLFDVDGTLFLTPDGLYLDALVESVREVWGHELTEQSFARAEHRPGETAMQGLRHLLLGEGPRARGDRRRPRSLVHRVLGAVRAAARAHADTPLAGRAQVVETLDELAQDHDLALLTGNPEPVARARMSASASTASSRRAPAPSAARPSSGPTWSASHGGAPATRRCRRSSSSATRRGTSRAPTKPGSARSRSRPASTRPAELTDAEHVLGALSELPNALR